MVVWTAILTNGRDTGSYSRKTALPATKQQQQQQQHLPMADQEPIRQSIGKPEEEKEDIFHDIFMPIFQLTGACFLSVTCTIMLARYWRQSSEHLHFMTKGGWVKTTGVVKTTPYYQKVRTSTGASKRGVYSESSEWVSRNVDQLDKRPKWLAYLLPFSTRGAATGATNHENELPYAVFNLRYEFQRNIPEEKEILEEMDRTAKFFSRLHRRFAPGQKNVFSKQHDLRKVEGRNYRAMESGSHKVESKERAVELCARFPKGKKIDVYYSPLDPAKNSAVEPPSEIQQNLLKKSIKREAVILILLTIVAYWTTITTQEKVANQRREKRQQQQQQHKEQQEQDQEQSLKSE